MNCAQDTLPGVYSTDTGPCAAAVRRARPRSHSSGYQDQGSVPTEASARTRRTPQEHAADAYGTSFLKRGKSNWCIKRQEAAYFGGRRTRVESSLV